MQQIESTGDKKKIKLSIGEKEPVRRSIRIANLTNTSRGKNPAIDIYEFEAEKNSINHRLDHDCLANIFSYLPALDRLEITKVCKKWEEAVKMSWHSIKKIDSDNLLITINKKEAILKELLKKCCQYLTYLKSDCQYSWMADVLRNNCKNIVYLDVNLCSEYSHSFYEIIGSMDKLKCLKATMNSDIYYNLVIELVNILPTKIEEIHFLERKGEIMEARKNAPAFDKFSNLRCLTLRKFCLTTSTIESILLNKNSLVYLDLNGCSLPPERPIIFTELVNLEHINLNRVKYLNDNIITEIAHNCPKLKYLFVACYSESPMRLSTFSELKYLKNLEHLDVPRVEELDYDDYNLMFDVFNNCKKLKHLDVGEGWNLPSSVVKEMTKLKNLEFLNLYYANVDSQTFIKIVNNCRELKELTMSSENLSDIDLEKFKNLKKLENLVLFRCENLTGNILSKIVNNCKNLVELNLNGCHNVTEASLLQVGKLQYLKTLAISEIENVPNAMFYNIHQLESLVCHKCPSVTDEGIIKVIDNCRKLFFLDVLRTGITVDTLVHAAKRKIAYKNLRIYVDNNVYDDYSELTDIHSPYLEIRKK